MNKLVYNFIFVLPILFSACSGTTEGVGSPDADPSASPETAITQFFTFLGEGKGEEAANLLREPEKMRATVKFKLDFQWHFEASLRQSLNSSGVIRKA